MWTCPHCFKLSTDAGAHHRHLERKKACQKETFNPSRRVAICHCVDGKKCGCAYRTKSR